MVDKIEALSTCEFLTNGDFSIEIANMRTHHIWFNKQSILTLKKISRIRDLTHTANIAPILAYVLEHALKFRQL